MIEYAYDLTGCAFPVIREFDIDNATAIKKGEPVTLSGGLITASGATPTNMIGVAVDAKVANNGKVKIRVYCSPTAVYRDKPLKVTASADGTSTTFVAGAMTAADDSFNGGYIKIKSSINKVDGNVAMVTDFTSATGTITTAGYGAITKATDTALLFPPVGSIGWKPNANTLGLNVTGGTAIQIVDVDTDIEVVYFKIKSQLI